MTIYPISQSKSFKNILKIKTFEWPLSNSNILPSQSASPTHHRRANFGTRRAGPSSLINCYVRAMRRATQSACLATKQSRQAQHAGAALCECVCCQRCSVCWPGGSEVSARTFSCFLADSIPGSGRLDSPPLRTLYLSSQPAHSPANLP